MFGGNITSQLITTARSSALRARLVAAQPERGAGMAEYGLLLALVLIVAFVSVSLFGDQVFAMFDSTSTTFNDARTKTAN